MHILITAGGTREYIDPVRFISNASSGRMGFCLAQAAIKAGHRVTLITAPTNLNPPPGAKVVNVETGSQMFTAVKRFFPGCDCLIMAAAVSDFKPVKKSPVKLKKTKGVLVLSLKPTRDILKWAGNHKKKRQKVVGFALEDKNILVNAGKKMVAKKLDMIVANTSNAIGASQSAIQIKTKQGSWTCFKKNTKSNASVIIIKAVEKLA